MFMSIFVNFSNHMSAMWSEAQKQSAKEYGEVVDLPFPNVPSKASEAEVEKLAEDYVQRILEYQPAAVMCQGEFTLAYAVIKRLLAQGITVVAACAERQVEEEMDERGQLVKKVVFAFAGFRRYC